VTQTFSCRLPAVFSPAETAAIVDLGEAVGFGRGALVGGIEHATIRRSEIAWLDEAATPAWIGRRLAEAAAQANRDHFGFELTQFHEQLQIARYDAGDSGHFDWHSDIGGGALARLRKLTLVVPLSPPGSHAGGVLELNEHGHAVPAGAGQGDVSVIASFVLHRVTPVTAGRRHSLTCWVHGPRFR
jgi:PKHD-type hydroxylase